MMVRGTTGTAAAIVASVRAYLFAVLVASLVTGVALVAQERPSRIVVASKNFAESRILAQMMAALIEEHVLVNHPGVEVERKTNLSGTKVVFSALTKGEVHLYAEYTGTAWAILLQEEGKVRDPLRTYFHVQRECRRRFDLEWLQPFGLDNTYSICVRKDVAERLGLRTLSDLAEHGGELRAAFSNEFMNREDGLPGLRAAYGLALREVRGMEHGLAYAALDNGEIDVLDAYATDGKLLEYPVVQLDDDLGFFPPYQAAPLVRADILAAFPELREVLNRLSFRLPDSVIQRLNHAVEAEGRSHRAVAEEWLRAEGLVGSERDVFVERRGTSLWSLFTGAALRQRLLQIRDHLALTLIAVLLAVLVAVPVGVFATRSEPLRQAVLGFAGVLQTIPSLALLAFMIPIPGFGIGVQSAIAALFLYAILPILRNTITGIEEVDRDLVEAGRGMGLRDGQILRLVQIPLAVPTIMAGVRTSTVIGIGVATLAAFIGAGGLGEPILTGLQLNDTNLILAGALPAAALALVVDFGLARVEKWVGPKAGA